MPDLWLDVDLGALEDEPGMTRIRLTDEGLMPVCGNCDETMERIGNAMYRCDRCGLELNGEGL